MSNQCLKDLFKASCDKYDAKTAISFVRDGNVETEISYRDLERDSNRLANTFLDRGIRTGDRIILFFPKSLFFVLSYLALQKIGGIAVPINPGFKEGELSYLLKDAQPSLVLAGKEQNRLMKKTNLDIAVEKIDTDIPYKDIKFFKSASDNPLNVDLSPTDIGLIIYTSGTTGNPKGAVLTNQNLAHDALNIINIWEISESDVLCHSLPLFHVHGLCYALNAALIAGSKIIMLDVFSSEKVIDLLSKKEPNDLCTLFMGVPTMYAGLIEAVQDKGLDFEHVRLWTSGSAPLPPKNFNEIQKVFGKEPVEREGMSETGMNFSNPFKGKRKAGSIGVPLPGLEVRVVDPETYIDVSKGSEGEIWLRGPGISPGYWRKPEETAKAFSDGWFKTGDLGRVDEDGYYFLTDRLKHIIISGGENISPKEIENVINQIPGVKESSVVGLPDEKWGERVVAAVVKESESPIEPSDVKETCLKKLHKWKCPKEVVFIDQLPKNAMGKVMKEDVKKIEAFKNTYLG